MARKATRKTAAKKTGRKAGARKSARKAASPRKAPARKTKAASPARKMSAPRKPGATASPLDRSQAAEVPQSASPGGSFSALIGSFMSNRNDDGQKTDEGTKPT
jgi:hypothetical protein